MLIQYQRKHNYSLKMFLLKNLHLTGLFLLGLVLLSYTERTLAKADTKTIWKGKGSTENLKEIIIGRCFNYLGIVNPDAGEKDCPKLWEAFLSAFSKKDPCKITKEDYKLFLDLAGHDIPINQSIFWSQTKRLILQYTDVTHKVMPLESTLIGYMVDGLNWCGKLSSSEPNFEACPGWNECENNSMRSFWKAASEDYAMRAQGEVTVMLNGSAYRETFRNNSIFGEIELGKLDNTRVTFVQLWIMDNINGPDKESCGVSSVAVLERILKQKNIKHSCKDNYKAAKMLQCIDNLEHPSCELGEKPNDTLTDLLQRLSGNF
ncbi:ADP-ribosyl cyclase/cyclic ADP-ribose hydrolase 1-like [Stegostoma tigrinum]|uniref:ADP-ribosyl cyclase/cyclic ADP-ribose hydrolase 1-like n=1 Tax=Stegostoma tigrinum TaxID=3053191 RepID=UPI00202B8A32|nr:ADP-ribosyl cyclase/cyclic ADP-ribose hydrolase 1-like [Stegostoma tigrinum]